MSESVIRVAAAQMNCQDDVAANLGVASELVSEAARRGARLVLLPENFAFLGPEPERRALAERLGDERAPIQEALARMARSARLTVIAGGFPERSDDPERPYNTCLVLGPDGERVAAYRKIHLFDVALPDGTKFEESSATSPGSKPVVADVGGFKVGLSICYDLRFPELYRSLVDGGAELLVVPAAFTLTTGKDHWHVLLRARAIESQCWVIAAAQWGRHPRGRASYGHALIADPWGQIVAECSDRVGLVVADLDRDYLDRVRASLPSLAHRVL
ncbi:MAG: carbon-nitrogen hydrolase family protein [Sorangiineae bacterium]|nr:carbon-nitrogen hydrolase family protein [Polyangiaceae bacterium]MEB2321251.1 carbon-nitrogen hydrolase family protein [Sorangiineae bacterium]